ncbi:MAG: ATP synthase F1 subunit delta [Actinobacteria bacterium]|nr:ATP synthase F1 subunit delta [Actinomycetota bacterium]
MSDARIDAYASAISEMAVAEGVLERVVSELRDVKAALESNESLRAHLTDELVPVEARQRTLEALLGGKAHAVTTQFVGMVIGAGRGRDLAKIVDAAARRSSGATGKGVAEVRSAVPLTDDQQRRLADALARATNGQVSLKVIVDPNVVGGLVATVGDKVIDGSVRNRLDQIKGRL